MCFTLGGALTQWRLQTVFLDNYFYNWSPEIKADYMPTLYRQCIKSLPSLLTVNRLSTECVTTTYWVKRFAVDAACTTTAYRVAFVHNLVHCQDSLGIHTAESTPTSYRLSAEYIPIMYRVTRFIVGEKVGVVWEHH